MALTRTSFRPGNPGKPKGAVSKTTRDIREFSQSCLTDPEYVTSLKRRLKSGDAPHMETLLFHYAYGKPKDTLSVETPMRPLIIDALLTGELTRPADDD